jgi:hypothetical protein
VLASAGEPDVTPTLKAKAKQLVRQLGDDSNDVRRKAVAELIKLDSAADEALRAGLTDTDLEVRILCREVLSRLTVSRRQERLKGFLADVKDERPLPGWLTFANLVGKEADRTYFAEMFRSQFETLETELNPDAMKAQIAKGCSGLRIRAVTPKRDETLIAEVLVLIVLVSTNKTKVEATAWNQLFNGLEALGERSAVVKKLQADKQARLAMASFLRNSVGSIPAERAVNVALALRIGESVPWALGLALDEKTAVSVRSAALLLVGKLGDKTLLPKLQPLLRDKTVVGTKVLGKITLKAELRDVALGAVVMLKGEKLEDYDFPYPKVVPGLKALPAPVYLGFATDAERDTAFKKWRNAMPEK